MLNTSHQLLLGGEISDTTPVWNIRGQAARDECLKLYIPIRGRAEIKLEGESFSLIPSKIYLFNATKLEAQHYQNQFHHCWIHFLPASLQLRQLMFKHFKYAQWALKQLPSTSELIKGIKERAKEIEALRKHTMQNIYIPWAIQLADNAFDLKIQSFLTFILGDVIDKQKLSLSRNEQVILDKLSPAIEYMDQHYLDNPTLATVAAQAVMAPSYFQRLFTRHFNISPHQFMLRKRLSDARQLLYHTQQSIKEIAFTCGYENEFYFSKVFKQEHRMTPSQFRCLNSHS